jgi:hypothetical protein
LWFSGGLWILGDKKQEESKSQSQGDKNSQSQSESDSKSRNSSVKHDCNDSSSKTIYQDKVYDWFRPQE